MNKDVHCKVWAKEITKVVWLLCTLVLQLQYENFNMFSTIAHKIDQMYDLTGPHILYVYSYIIMFSLITITYNTILTRKNIDEID